MRFNVGDRVRIKSLDWYNENKNDTGRVVCGNLSLGCLNKGYCGKVFTIDKVYIDYYTVKENSAYWNDMMIEGLAEDEIIDLTSIVMKTVEDKTIQNALTYGYNLPEGYQFVDENGNVINATKIVLEKKEKEYTKGAKVRHKTKGMVETIVGVCKIKYMGAWVDGIIYEGNDTNTGESMTFVRIKEDFENNFEVL
jgi:hypothetical protein